MSRHITVAFDAPPPQVVDVLLQPFALLDERLHAVGQLRPAHAQHPRRRLGRCLDVSLVALGPLAGEKLKASQAGANAPLGHRHHRTDLPGALNVGAAAELGRELPEADDADNVAVLLAEEHHGAAPARILKRHHVGGFGQVVSDSAVDDPEDGVHLVGADGPVEVEVERAGVGRNV